MNDIELVIFDCDGVLVDSEIIGTRIEAELLAANGYTISVERLTKRFSGMSWKDILQAVEKERGLKLTDSLLDKVETVLDTRLPAEVHAIDGVRDVLSSLKYKRCICSNTKLSRVDAMLTRVDLKGFFAPDIFSAKDLGEGRSKPKPDIFLHGAERMGVRFSRTVVVEDSVHGVQAARCAGMRIVGFTGGSHTYPDHARRLREAGAHVVIPHMRDVLPTLTQMAS